MRTDDRVVVEHGLKTGEQDGTTTLSKGTRNPEHTPMRVLLNIMLVSVDIADGGNLSEHDQSATDDNSFSRANKVEQETRQDVKEGRRVQRKVEVVEHWVLHLVLDLEKLKLTMQETMKVIK